MQIVALCRAGFEKEVAAELNDLARDREIFGYVRASNGSGFAEYVCSSSEDTEKLMRGVLFSDLVFIRHWFMSSGAIAGLAAGERVEPLLDSLKVLPGVSDFTPHTLDTNEGKSLGTLAKSIRGHLLNKHGRVLETHADWCGDLLFIDGSTAFVGCHLAKNSSSWPSGIPRLKQPRGAPSRATLKLEEAWHHFVPKTEWEKRLTPGMSATDLGAAPGGWTWQLVNKSMFVDAVDNGGMDSQLMESGQVRHHRIDAFQYKPAKPSDWLVCDIADKPARVAALISRWAVNRWFKEAIFNLKLPMKQRYEAVRQCREIIAGSLGETDYSLRFKHLYHDREEVTGHLCLNSRD